MKQSIFVSILALALGGCGTSIGHTASFAPPTVSISPPAKQQNLIGALAFVDEYIQSYRDTGSDLSNGRQFFDVPAFIVGSGGATAAALGASPDVAIGTGAFTAITSGAKGYYKPNDRADVYYDAVEALTCIQQRALGLPTFARIALSKPETKDKTNGKPKTNGYVEQRLKIAVVNDPTMRDKRIYRSIVTAVFKVENIARNRLGNVGQAPDIKKLFADVKRAEAEVEGASIPSGDKSTAELRATILGAESADHDKLVALDMLEEAYFQELIPKLDQCTLIAQGAPVSTD